MALSVPAEPYHFVRRMLFRIRWVTMLALLLIALAQPTPIGPGPPAWILVVAFACYNLAADLIRLRLPHRFSFTWLATLDLLVAGVFYFLGGEGGGLLFVLFVLAVDSAAAGLTLRGTLVYTAAVAITAAAIEAGLPFWSSTPMDVRRLGTRLIMLALIGAGMAIVMRRLVSEHEAMRTVQGEADRLEELDRLRAAFISGVSHDLRTPLTAARAGLGMLETSMSHRLRADEQALLGDTRRNIEHLNLLIDDLLTFNQLEAGVLHIERQLLDLRTVVTGAMSAVQPLMEEKGQTLKVDLPEPLPTYGDARRLEQVVVNLLANAQRHTPKGAKIMVTGEATDREVTLRVSDTGPGIPQEETERVFERFYRLAPTSGGSGLGLSLAQGIIALHEGRIWAESSPGQGATFYVTLLRAADADVRNLTDH